MIECPDCGKNFRSSKCSCGYEPPRTNPAEIAERMRKARDQALNEYERGMAGFSQKQEVISVLPGTGSKKWAHEIIALNKAGLYSCTYGIELAKRVV